MCLDERYAGNIVASEDPKKVIRSLIPAVQDRLGMVDTLASKKERDSLLGEIIRLKKKKKALM